MVRRIISRCTASGVHVAQAWPGFRNCSPRGTRSSMNSFALATTLISPMRQSA
jgi:hypothetical protein